MRLGIVLTRVIKGGFHPIKEIPRDVIGRGMLGKLRANRTVDLDAYYECVRCRYPCIFEEAREGGQSTF